MRERGKEHFGDYVNVLKPVGLTFKQLFTAKTEKSV